MLSCNRVIKMLSFSLTGVAELGGPGGPWPPPKNLSGRAKVYFGPPKILTTGPPKMGASGKNLYQIASEHPEICKILPAAG